MKTLSNRLQRLEDGSAVGAVQGFRVFGYDEAAAEADPEGFERFRNELRPHFQSEDANLWEWPMRPEEVAILRPHWPCEDEAAMIRRILRLDNIEDWLELMAVRRETTVRSNIAATGKDGYTPPDL